LNINQQFEGIRLHRAVHWWFPRSGGTPDFSSPAW
jgi:hypothetical protein